MPILAQGDDVKSGTRANIHVCLSWLVMASTGVKWFKNHSLISQIVYLIFFINIFTVSLKNLSLKLALILVTVSIH